ncbi:hypothetical protein [Acidiphilium sp.]|uniref:hypothetical protein n=1 Tax=Acidiphilium sp. TaxID=527 RepID=UPI003D034252
MGPFAIPLEPFLAALATYILAEVGIDTTKKILKHASNADDEGNAKPASPTQSCPDATQKEPEISRQKQDGHIKGTPQNENRLKQGKPTSTFDGSKEDADQLTQEAAKKGQPVPGRPGVKDWNAGRRIGTGPNGGGQDVVRVHEDSQGRIHGHPSGPEN